MFMKLPEVLEFRHRSRSSHLRDIKNGLCTTPIKVGSRSVAWLRSELEIIRSAQIAGRSPAQIQAIVTELQADRERSFRRVVGSDD